jgi:hypothetical protein
MFRLSPSGLPPGTLGVPSGRSWASVPGDCAISMGNIEIGIGGDRAAPLPHHPACGSAPGGPANP